MATVSAERSKRLREDSPGTVEHLAHDANADGAVQDWTAQSTTNAAGESLGAVQDKTNASDGEDHGGVEPGRGEASYVDNKGKKRKTDVANSEEDTYLAAANVTRVMRRAMRPETLLAKQAISATQVCLSEFVLVVVGEACDRCKAEGRKIVRGEDILWSLRELGMELYHPPLAAFINALKDAPQ